MHLTRCECSGHHRKRIPRPLWARLLFPGRIMLLCDRCGKRQLVPL